MEEQRPRLFTRNRGLPSRNPTPPAVTIVLFNIPSRQYPSLDDELHRLQHFQIVRIDDINECVDLMTADTSDSTILLIIPQMFVDVAQTLCEILPQIKRIYLICDETTVSPQDDDGRYFFGNVHLLVSTLVDDICQQTRNTKQKMIEGKSGQSLSREPATFVWYKFFFSLLDQVQPTKIAIRELIDIMRLKFNDNQRDKLYLDRFESSYSSENALYFYTLPSFFYRMVNQTLRSGDINAIFECRAVLLDIQRQLRQLHDIEMTENVDDFKEVYRGQGITTHEIQYYIDNLHNLIAINPILSTSSDRHVAQIYADAALYDDKQCPVVFTIHVPSNVQQAIHASVQHLSAFAEEAERLISWRSLFRVETVEREETRLWAVHLTLVDEDDPQFRELMKAWETSLGDRSFFHSRQTELFMRDLNQMNGPFLSFQLLMDIVLRLNRTNYAMEEMLELCREKYANNQTELNKIEEFERMYSGENAVRWYTKDSFLHRLLNETLRLERIDTIFKLRLFIHDLHNQLADLQGNYLRTLPEDIRLLTFYRGQTMTIDELRQFQKGRLMSVNSFLSATTDQNIAHTFAGDVDDGVQDPLVSVIYEITVDLTVPHSIPFASIAHLAANSDEEEVLFSMAAVFCIDEIEQHKERVWNVKLSLINKEDENWTALTAHLK